MSLQTRDKRALWLLAAAVVVMTILRFSLPQEDVPEVVAASGTVSSAENRLARVQQVAASLPALQEQSRVLSAELAQREEGILRAETAAQAQAQLLEILRRMGEAQSPPMEIRTVEIGRARPLSDDYGEASVTVSFECRIEQLVNLLADLSRQRETLATESMNVRTANEKEKTVNVRLAVSGIVPRALVPERRGMGSF